MTNVIRFPNQLQPDPADDLIALEIELVRTRLAQIRSETRRADTIWFWYCARKAVFWLAVLYLLTILL
jgi:hypothetical protein